MVLMPHRCNLQPYATKEVATKVVGQLAAEVVHVLPTCFLKAAATCNSELEKPGDLELHGLGKSAFERLGSRQFALLVSTAEIQVLD